MKIKNALRCVLAALVALFAINTTLAQDVVTYYHTDATGSPVAATDANGNVLWREDYSPYGERLRQENSPRTNRMWFTGHHADDDSGLTYAGARHYDPMIGRFTGIDPAGVDESNQFSFSRYAYANNNPYKFVDPDGRETGAAYSAMYKLEVKYGMTTSGSKLTEQQAGLIVDFMPIIGDAKGYIEVYKDPSPLNFLGATIGLIPVLGDAGKLYVRHYDDLIKAAGSLERLKGGVRQGRVEGDAQAIFDSITEGGEKISGGRIRMDDGSIIGTHKSKSTGQSTIDINKGDQIYKIRVDEPKK